jgi:hypothetical protein
MFCYVPASAAIRMRARRNRQPAKFDIRADLLNPRNKKSGLSHFAKPTFRPNDTRTRKSLSCTGSAKKKRHPM